MPAKEPDGPSLELPSFRLGRRRTKPGQGPEGAASAEPAPEQPAVVEARGEESRTTPLLGLGALPAALLTGVVVGLLTAILGYASQRLCEAVRGTSSCGGAGVLVLLAILVSMTVLGAAALRATLVPEPTSTSFLAVALLAVLVMLFLIDAAFSPLMFVVLPLLAAGCYALSHRVTASTRTD